MSTLNVRIGVLAIQGSVEEHMDMLKKIGISPVAVKTKADLDKVDGLIIPGGESTTIGKLMKLDGLDREIRARAKKSFFSRKKPLAVWGTCAGAILLAKKVLNNKPDILGLMDITIARNAYGRQTDSFETSIYAPSVAREKIPAVFIRAPKIEKVSKKAEVLAVFEGTPVMVRQKNLLATTFHPELTSDTRVHEYFVSMIGKPAGLLSK